MLIAYPLVKHIEVIKFVYYDNSYNQYMVHHCKNNSKVFNFFLFCLSMDMIK